VRYYGPKQNNAQKWQKSGHVNFRPGDYINLIHSQP